MKIQRYHSVGCWTGQKTQTLIGIARYDVDTAAIAGSKPNITFGKYEITEIQEEHTETQLVTQGDIFRGSIPGEPFRRELISMLVNNNDNNRLTENLMNTIINPYTNRATQDDTQEAQTAHQKSFQREIEEHKKKAEREEQIERERERERKRKRRKQNI